MGSGMLGFGMKVAIGAVIFAGVANATIFLTVVADTHTPHVREALVISRAMMAREHGLNDRAFLDEHVATYLGEGRYQVSGLFWNDAPETALERYVVTLSHAPDRGWTLLDQRLMPLR
jgi:hypothetical protein